MTLADVFIHDTYLQVDQPHWWMFGLGAFAIVGVATVIITFAKYRKRP
ncbi:MAG: hypothetical protein SGJ19_03595 [Planctomycetia bacterium]|nr:hypothetical protein [Planctomycetia bacterium]